MQVKSANGDCSCTTMNKRRTVDQESCRSSSLQASCLYPPSYDPIAFLISVDLAVHAIPDFQGNNDKQRCRDRLSHHRKQL